MTSTGRRTTHRNGRRLSRHGAWLLPIPAILYCLTPVIANRIHPMIAGMPFIIAYAVAVTILTWAIIWLVARLDPVYRSQQSEPVPADRVFGYDATDEEQC